MPIGPIPGCFHHHHGPNNDCLNDVDGTSCHSVKASRSGAHLCVYGVIVRAARKLAMFYHYHHFVMGQYTRWITCTHNIGPIVLRSPARPQTYIPVCINPIHYCLSSLHQTQPRQPGNIRFFPIDVNPHQLLDKRCGLLACFCQSWLLH